jgi:tetratricopeptide (TPR) repeat protein
MAAVRQRRLRRLGVAAAVVVILAIAAFLARDFLFPPNPVGDAVANAGAKLNAGDQKAALAEIELGLGVVPTSSELFIWKGLLLEAAGDPAGAQAAYDQARAHSQNDREFYLTRAQTCIQLGLPDRVIADADAVLAITPDSPEALYIRSTGYEMKGDRLNAMLDLDKSAELAQKAGNDALYAMARYRYAILMQSVDQSTPAPSPAPSP